MSELSYVLVEINIQSNVLTKENIEQAKKEIPKEFEPTSNEPTIQMTNGKASLIFSCHRKVTPEETEKYYKQF